MLVVVLVFVLVPVVVLGLLRVCACFVCTWFVCGLGLVCALPLVPVCVRACVCFGPLCPQRITMTLQIQ